jgi:hypothetical protein
VVTQVIKALSTRQSHSYLVRERPRTLKELYDNYRKFNKSKVLHFRKLEQQRKVPKENKASRLTKYNRGRENTMSFDNTTKQIHNIDSDGCPLKIGTKILGLRNQKIEAKPSTKECHHPRGGYTGRGRGHG